MARSLNLVRFLFSSEVAAEANAQQDALEGERVIPCLVAPTVLWRRLWGALDPITTLLVLILLPMQIAFEDEIGLHGGALFLGAMADVFMLADVPVQFRTGYEDARGHLVMDPWRIARHYMRGSASKGGPAE